MNKRAFEVGFVLGMQKKAIDPSILGLVGGGALGALGGAASTPKDKEGNRDKMSMLLRMLLLGGGGALAGGYGVPALGGLLGGDAAATEGAAGAEGAAGGNPIEELAKKLQSGASAVGGAMKDIQSSGLNYAKDKLTGAYDAAAGSVSDVADKIKGMLGGLGGLGQ